METMARELGKTVKRIKELQENASDDLMSAVGYIQAAITKLKKTNKLNNFSKETSTCEERALNNMEDKLFIIARSLMYVSKW